MKDTHPAVEKVARAICCPSGCRAKPTGGLYQICQAFTYRDDAPAIIRAVLDLLAEPSEAALAPGNRRSLESFRLGAQADADLIYLDVLAAARKEIGVDE